jgi:DNA replication protein DnaC
MSLTGSITKDLIRIITLGQAEKEGFDISEAPETTSCRFCGSNIEPTAVCINISGMIKKIIWRNEQRCNCDESKKYWYIYDEEEKEERNRILKEEEEKKCKEKISKMINYSNLGERFRNRTFSTFKIKNFNIEAYKEAKKYADKFSDYMMVGRGIFFSGNTGTGKTHLAAAICLELVKHDYQPVFGTLIALLDKIRFTYNEEYINHSEERILDQYVNCDLLVIDDLGKERATEWAIEKLYYIVNARYEKNLPIVITSNYEIRKLIERLTIKNNIEAAEAIVSRLCEMCIGVRMNGEDHRKQ